MNEFIKKLIERLESKIEITWKHDYQGGRKDAFNEAIEIVNQLAEEYNNDVCEWKSDFNYFSGRYKRETSCGYTFYDLNHAEPFKVCPYCGKKIKVV